MMSRGFEEIIKSDGCDDNDIMRWPIVIAIIRSHVNYTEMMTDGGAGQESWWQCLYWHRCHDIMSRMSRDISSDLVTCACVCPPSPSCQYPLFKCPSPPASHASASAPVDSRERGELNWNHLKWSILHHRIGLTLKTTIYNAPTEHGWIKTDCDRHQMYSHHQE